MTGTWFWPRVFAVLAAVCVGLAVVYPWLGFDWRASAGMMLAAGVFVWIVRFMAGVIRSRQELEHTARRLSHDYRLTHVHPPRVSSTPEVSIRARMLATPDPKVGV